MTLLDVSAEDFVCAVLFPRLRRPRRWGQTCAACRAGAEGMVQMMAMFQANMHRLVTALALSAALAAVAVAPASGEGPVLSTPDRRAIPLMVTKLKTEHRYGTGVIVAPTTILTASHVVVTTVEVVLPKAKVAGRVVCRMRDRDVAVVRVTLPKGTPRYKLAFRTPKAGEALRVGGYPGRRWRTASGRVTHIIKSAVLSGRRVNTPMVVFKPALDQGASGSPVLDAKGLVVGVFVASNEPSNYSIMIPTSTGLGPCRSYIK